MDSDSFIKYKCEICNHTLSSKQRIMTHLEIIHPSHDRSATNYRKIRFKFSDKKKSLNGGPSNPNSVRYVFKYSTDNEKKE